MRKLLATALVGAALVFGLGACETDSPPITGTIVDKYIEDFEEPTLVLQTADGEKYHFTVTQDQYDNTALNSNFSTANLDTATDD